MSSLHLTLVFVLLLHFYGWPLDVSGSQRYCFTQECDLFLSCCIYSCKDSGEHVNEDLFPAVNDVSKHYLLNKRTVRLI